SFSQGFNPRYLPSFPTRRSSDLTFSKEDRIEVINRWLQQLSTAPTSAISLMKKQLRFPPADQESAWISQAHSTVSSALTMDFAEDRKSTRLNSSHVSISYAVFCL